MPPAGNRFQTVFIGNLSYDGTEDELRSLFAQMGPISTLRVVVDRETGKRKGFAFLEFFDQDTAQRAVHELDGVDFYGRTLRVSIAEQDTKHGDSSSASAASRKERMSWRVVSLRMSICLAMFSASARKQRLA